MTTVNGRPTINHDWDTEYLKQRKNRLTDSVDEYLQDSDTSILAFYNDLKDVIEELITYHKQNKEKAEGALQLILGHRPVTIDPKAWEEIYYPEETEKECPPGTIRINGECADL